MVKYWTAILLFAVAVFWPSISARSVHGHYEEPHHGISVENDAFIEEFLQWALKHMDDNAKNSDERTAVSNILHETKHRHWSSFDEFARNLRTALRNYERDLAEKNSRSRRSVESDSDETLEDLTGDQFAKAILLTIIKVAPPAHKSALSQKFEEVFNKDYDLRFHDFVDDVRRVFKEVTGDDIDKYEDQLSAALKSGLGDFENGDE